MEGVGDAAQPLQHHGDAPPVELAGEVYNSAIGAERGDGELPDASRVCEKAVRDSQEESKRKYVKVECTEGFTARVRLLQNRARLFER